MMPQDHDPSNMSASQPQAADAPVPSSVALSSSNPPTSDNDPIRANIQETAKEGGSPVAAADDAELIEDEWVAIVKRIVNEHRDDPYLLNRAMTMLRADYLMKRYKKDIKIPE